MLIASLILSESLGQLGQFDVPRNQATTRSARCPKASGNWATWSLSQSASTWSLEISARRAARKLRAIGQFEVPPNQRQPTRSARCPKASGNWAIWSPSKSASTLKISARRAARKLRAIGQFGVTRNQLQRRARRAARKLRAIGQLGVLVISNDALGALPESFGQLGNLKSLEISDNDALGALPESFGQLGNLTSLEISRNDALGALPESFGQLGNLKSLKCYNNASARCPKALGNWAI